MLTTRWTPQVVCLLFAAAIAGCAARAQYEAPTSVPTVTYSASTEATGGSASAGYSADYEAAPVEASVAYDAADEPMAEESAAPARASRRGRAGRGRSTASTPAPAPAQPAAMPVSRPAPSGSGMAAGESAPAGVSRYGAAVPTPPPPPAPSPYAYRQQVPVVVALTAASVGDVDRRGPYLDYLTRHPAEAAQIGLDLSRRVRFRVLDQRSRPVPDAVISFTTGGVRVEGRTHADGWWDFFPGISAPQAAGPAAVSIRWGNAQGQATVVVPSVGDSADVVVQLPGAVAVTPTTLDLAFVIDVTGSMGDELAYVNAEVQGIVQRVRSATNQANVRLAATFYRDRGDMQPLQQINFTQDVAAFNAQMSQIMASGGGDYPEDVNAALGAAMTTLSWSTGPAVRVLVLIGDAPPQQYPDSQFTYREAVRDASRRGIRILPVAASGADRVVEYLWRAMGAATSTPYVYLTNDSGIGGHHMEADTDRISVEMFSDLLTRLLIADLQGLGMHEPSHAGQEQIVVPR